MMGKGEQMHNTWHIYWQIFLCIYGGHSFRLGEARGQDKKGWEPLIYGTSF